MSRVSELLELRGVNTHIGQYHILHGVDFAVAPIADGSWVTVPVKVAVGTRRRPRFVAIAGIHGDEPDGMLALLDFWDRLQSADLRGTIILVPVANPPAFAHHQRRNPLDNLDLNRSFPGHIDGTPTERLAYRLVHDILKGADFLFTLHSWYASGMVAPYVEFPEGTSEVAVRSRQAAVAAGFKRLRAAGWPQGVLGLTAVEMGIPVLEAEIGGQGMSTRENRAAYADHLARLLQHLGISEGDSPSNPAPELYGRGFLYAPVSGMLRLAVLPGEHVEAGVLLATITNLHGDLLAEMRAPHSGLVAAVRMFVSVNSGELVFAFYPRL